MSIPGSIFDQILENDECVRCWKNQVIETENLIKSMQNDLEMEQAKETLLFIETRGKILQVEQLTLRSSQQANERLQNLMLDQLVEINKSEILVKVNEENYKQCAISLREIARWEPHMPELIVTGSHAGQQEESEIPMLDEARNSVASAKELKDDEKKAIEEDISKIEDAIAESEKEHAVLKEFLSEHQQLLTEIEYGVKTDIPASRKRLCDNVDHTTIRQSAVPPAQPQESSTHQWELKTRIGASEAAPSSIDPAQICSMPRPYVPNRTFEPKSAIISKTVGTIQNPLKDFAEGYGVDYPTSVSVKSTSVAEPTQMKQARLSLYDTPGANQPTPTRSQALTKSFKPKIPSVLINRIN